MNDWRRVDPVDTRRKGILLAGGAGTRLHPMTLPTSKQLLPVYDKPLVYYPLSVLMLAGVREILVITTGRDRDAFQRLLGDGSQWGLSLAYAVQDSPDGLPQAYILGETFLDAAPSMMILGDNVLYGARLAGDVRRAGARDEGATAFAYRVRDPERFGVVVLDAADRPVELLEKPSPSPSPWAVIGLYLMDADAPRRARELRPSPRGELEITDLLRSYLAESRLRVELLGRGVSWLDTGTPRALLQAAQFVEVLQERQGLQVACPEEIAFRMGFIDADGLGRLAHELRNTEYGQYLSGLLAENGRVHA
jgi:glucose-1-phosphate thymidylyltransferase